MSLIRSCIRLAAVAAIRRAVWPEVIVLDSDNRPLETAILAAGKANPYVVVWSGRDQVDEQADSEADARILHLTVIIGVAAPIKASAGGPSVAMPAATDASFEAIVDALDRVVTDAITAGAGNPWSEALHEMAIPRGKKYESERGGAAETGSRWAAREVVFELSPLIEPAIGAPVPEQVTSFLAQASAERSIADVARFIAAALQSAQLPSWQQAEAQLGLSEQGARGLAIAPVVLPDGEAPVLETLDTPQTEWVPGTQPGFAPNLDPE